jgi:hypothetical protein
MTTGQIVGIAFVFAGLIDLGLGFLVVGPRIPDEGRRRVVLIALTLGAVTLLAFGAAFLTGALTVGAPSTPES